MQYRLSNQSDLKNWVRSKVDGPTGWEWTIYQNVDQKVLRFASTVLWFASTVMSSFGRYHGHWTKRSGNINLDGQKTSKWAVQFHTVHFELYPYSIMFSFVGLKNQNTNRKSFWICFRSLIVSPDSVVFITQLCRVGCMSQNPLSHIWHVTNHHFVSVNPNLRLIVWEYAFSYPWSKRHHGSILISLRSIGELITVLISNH